ncbi:hypothetical protein HY634_01825 [Candidatus Uhrbacteria bacterium]|nr:hypothetical protein [Candidatus Uhrbacteria bacterium]
MPIHTLPDGRRVRPATPEEAAARYDLVRRTFSSGPILVPYEVWSRAVDETCRTSGKPLARPTNFSHSRREGEREGEVTVAGLLQYQESFYRDRYPQFTVERSRIGLPRDRFDDILAAITRGEVNYPLVTALPRTLTERERSQTLHRVLMDRLIRARNIRVWQRTNPDMDTFLDHVRDLTLGDLTLGPEGWRAKGLEGLGPDGQPLTFTNVPNLRSEEQPWCRYLQALYPTLPRPTATPGHLDLSFVAWERDLPASRIIPGAQGPRGEQVTIQSRSQLDAVAFRYPLITPSRYLAFFAQYHAATGEYLDTNTWSWMFGIVDPVRFPDPPSVGANWYAGGLYLCRDSPGDARAVGRLRVSR